MKSEHFLFSKECKWPLIRVYHPKDFLDEAHGSSVVLTLLNREDCLLEPCVLPSDGWFHEVKIGSRTCSERVRLDFQMALHLGTLSA